MHLLSIFFFFFWALLLPQYHVCCAKLLQACLTLCDPMGRSPPGSSVHGILQARILGWVVMPSSISIKNCYLKSFYPMYFSCIYRSLGFPSISFFFFKSQQPSNSSQVKILGRVLRRREGWHGPLMVSCSAAREGRCHQSSLLRCLQIQGAQGSWLQPTQAHGSWEQGPRLELTGESGGWGWLGGTASLV